MRAANQKELKERVLALLDKSSFRYEVYLIHLVSILADIVTYDLHNRFKAAVREYGWDIQKMSDATAIARYGRALRNAANEYERLVEPQIQKYTFEEGGAYDYDAIHTDARGLLVVIMRTIEYFATLTDEADLMDLFRDKGRKVFFTDKDYERLGGKEMFDKAEGFKKEVKQ